MNDAALHRLFALQARGEIFEDLIAGLATTALRPGDLAIDGGANHGYHTWPLALQVGPQGRVLAIEPIPALAAKLRAAALARGLAQVEVIEAALSDRAGTAAFHWVRNGDGYSGLQARPYPFTPDTALITVRRLRLDDIADAGPRPWRFAKLDLEGGEYHALQGAQASIARWRPMLVLESGREIATRAYGYSRDDFFGLFARLDYRLLDLAGRRFGPAQWEAEPMPWYLVAAPEGSAEAAQAERHLTDTVARLAQSAG
jgi:FkbM family methyltransferase